MQKLLQITAQFHPQNYSKVPVLANPNRLKPIWRFQAKPFWSFGVPKIYISTWSQITCFIYLRLTQKNSYTGITKKITSITFQLIWFSSGEVCCRDKTVFKMKSYFNLNYGKISISPMFRWIYMAQIKCIKPHVKYKCLKMLRGPQSAQNINQFCFSDNFKIILSYNTEAKKQ